jgi:hypothetical protein
MRRSLALLALLALAAPLARAIDIHVTGPALERTLQQQLFTSPQGRYYLRGTPTDACNVYAEDPHVSFNNDRVVVKMTVHSGIGRSIAGHCIGVSLTTKPVVSLVPVAEGEKVGFRDAQIEKLSDNRELGLLLTPFLSHQLPKAMQINAADLLRQILAKSGPSIGYTFLLNNLRLHSLTVNTAATPSTLDLDVDADLTVQ